MIFKHSTQPAAPPPGTDTSCCPGPTSPGSWDFLCSQEGWAPKPGKESPDRHQSSKVTKEGGATQHKIKAPEPT